MRGSPLARNLTSAPAARMAHFMCTTTPRTLTKPISTIQAFTPVSAAEGFDPNLAAVSPNPVFLACCPGYPEAGEKNSNFKFHRLPQNSADQDLRGRNRLSHGGASISPTRDENVVDQRSPADGHLESIYCRVPGKACPHRRQAIKVSEEQHAPGSSL